MHDPIDIIRELHIAADRAELVCTNTGNFRAAMIDAAHLRTAAVEITRLRAERDEARRRFCEYAIQHGTTFRRTPQEVAEMIGWDCFKENTDD